MDSVANVISTPSASSQGSASQGSSSQGSAASAIGQSTDASGASDPTANAANGADQASSGTNGAFGKLLARQIARAVPQLVNAPETKPSVIVIPDAAVVPAVDPNALIQQLSADLNQLIAGAKDGADTTKIDQSIDKLLADNPALADDPALAGLLKKTKKSTGDDAADVDNTKGANPAIAVGNLPPTLAATTDATGKDLPKDANAISNQVPTATVISNKTQTDPTTTTEDKALNAFVNELTTKLAETNTDQTPTQQNPLNVISSAATVNTINNNRADITPQVGSQTWDSALGEKVVWIVGSQTQNAELHLNPPSLGPLEVRVSLSDGQANLSFMTQHAAVREAIEAATPKLREMMGDSGINMGSVSVNVGTFAQQQQDQAAQQQAASNRSNTPSNDFSFGAVADSTPAETVTTTVRPLRDMGMVDLFA